MAEPSRRLSNGKLASAAPSKRQPAAKPSGRAVPPPRSKAASRPQDNADEEPLIDEDDDIGLPPPPPPPVRAKAKAIDDDASLIDDENLPVGGSELDDEPPPPPKRGSVRAATAAGSSARTPAKSGRMEAPKAKSARVEPAKPAAKGGVSSRRAKPVVEEEDEDDDAELEAELDAAESGAHAEAVDDTDEAPVPEKRQSVRKSTRGAATSGKSSSGKKGGFTLKHKILAALAAILVLGAVIMYDPLMHSHYLTGLKTGATLEDRKSAAASLVNRYAKSPGTILQEFGEGLASDDPLYKEASAHGMVLLAKAGSASAVARELGDKVALGDPAGRVIVIQSIGAVAKAMGEEKSPNGKEIEAAAASLLLQIEAKEPKEVRAAAIEALGNMPVKGVAIALLKIAQTETDSALQQAARRGVANTALPETAGDLLKAMVGKDAELVRVATQTFDRVQQGAKSEELIPFVSAKNPEPVRKKIVEVLAARKADDKAAQGLLVAMRDPLVEIRLMAIKAVPGTFPSNMMIPAKTAFLELVKDPEEKVRIANAATLEVLSDPGSKEVLLTAFKMPMEGETLNAYIKALGRRITGKDMAAIDMIMGLLQSNASAEDAVSTAMLSLSNPSRDSRRASERKGWKAAEWTAWHTELKKLETRRLQTVTALEKLRGKMDGEKSQFLSYKKEVVTHIDELNALREDYKKYFPEDVSQIDAQIKNYTVLQEHFSRAATINVR